MKVVVISFLLVLITIEGVLCCVPSQSSSGGRRRPRPTKATITVPSCCPENDSPCGGPSQNTDAAVCYFYRSSLRVKCIKGNSVETCNVAKAPDSQESDPKGPTPYGEYLIGKYRYNTYYQGVDWFNLYPKKEDSSGYYGYYSDTRQGRSRLGLHPGRVSWGCVTVNTPQCRRGDSDCYNKDSCWSSIKNIVESGYLRYRTGDIFRGILYVI